MDSTHPTAPESHHSSRHYPLHSAFSRCSFPQCATSLRIYCPCLYFECLQNTFSDPQVFERLEESPESLINSMLIKLNQRFKKSYPWSMVYGQRPHTPQRIRPSKTKEAVPFRSPYCQLLRCPFPPHAELHRQAQLPTSSCSISTQLGQR